MPALRALRLPPIGDDTEFEEFCRDLWALVWDDPDAQRHGRSGQAQQGVDVFGLPKGQTTYCGVQCKAVATMLSDAELRAEIEAAKAFDPPLSHLTIATTAARDARAQKFIRSVNVDHAEKNLFRVVLSSWDDIIALVQRFMVGQHPELVERYFEVTVTSTSLVARLEERGTRIASVGPQVRVGDEATGPNSGQVHVELDYARALVNSGKPASALEYLEAFRARLWATAEDSVRFRVLHYQGVSYHMLERDQEAGTALVEARQYKQGDEVAETYAALGFLLLGDTQRAAAHARIAIEKNPASAKAYVFLLQASTIVEMNGAYALVPEPYRSLPEVAHALGYVAHDLGDLEAAERWFRISLQNEKEPWPELHGSLAALLMERVAGSFIKPAVFQLSPMKEQVLRKAEAELTVAWNGVTGTEMQHVRLGWLVNRSMVRRLLGDYDGALGDMDHVLRLDVGNIDYTVRLAMLRFERGDTPTSLRLLQDLLPCPDHPEVYVYLASQLLAAERTSEAITVLNQMPTENVPLHLRRTAARMRFAVLVNTDQSEEAQACFTQLRAEFADDVEILVDGARYYRRRNQHDDGLSLLAAAMETQTSDPVELRQLADELFAYNQYEQAACVFEQFVDRDANEEPTRRLMMCYYFTSQLNRALDLGRHMIALHGPLPVISEVTAEILTEIQDLPAARDVADAYLRSTPDDVGMLLRLAAIDQLMGNGAGVDAFLDRNVPMARLSVENKINVARLFAYRGRAAEALNLAYDVRRQNQLESSVHHFYIILMFSVRGEEQDRILSVATCQADAAVHVRDRDGQQHWYIIEDRDIPLLPGELPSSGSLATRLAGHRAGEDVVVAEPPAGPPVVLHVLEVKSKFLHALHESMQTFQQLFPEAPGIMNIPFATTETPEANPDFQPLFDMISERYAHTLRVESLYRQGRLTLGTMAHLAGYDLVTTWSGLINREGPGVRVSTGDVRQFGAAQDRLDGRKLVIDPISLLTLRMIDRRDSLAEAFGPFLIPQSTINLFRSILIEQDGSGRERGYTVIGREGDQFVRQDVTTDDIRRNVGFLNSLLEWTEQHCQTVPVSAALKVERSRREEFEAVLGAASYDSVLIATEAGNVLYSDDAILRSLAANEYGVDGVWTQVLLANARAHDAISANEYADDVLSLVYANYHHTHVGADILLRAASTSNWRPTRHFVKAASGLSAANCPDEAAALNIVAEFAHGMTKAGLLDLSRDTLLGEVLNQMVAGRSTRRLLMPLANAIRTVFRLLPLQEQSVLSYIAKWAETRPL